VHPSSYTSTVINHLSAQHTSEAAEVVDRRLRREAVDATQAAAAALIALRVLARTGDDTCNSAWGAGSGGRGSSSAAAAGNNGDGGGLRLGVGVDGLEGARDEAGAVGADGELLECGHCLVAGGRGVDAEDHALAAVDAVLLFAVEPWRSR